MIKIKDPPAPAPQATSPQAPVRTGGCLRKHWRAWQRISPQHAEWVRDGVRLPWQRIPRACQRKQRELDPMEYQQLDTEIARMLKMDAIVETSEADLVLSSVYTVPKKNGKRRMVINLRWVNEHLNKVHFKMSTMKDVKCALTKDCWMASIDLSDCFWALPVAERDQRALAFRFKGKTYKFKVLPFGLGPSPMFITKLYRKVVEYLQARGHRVMIYIDDILMLGATQAECEATAREVARLLKELGAVINDEKSTMTAAQAVDYLGFTLDSRTMTVTAPPAKMANLMKALKQGAKKSTLSARDVASILGKLTSMADAMLPVRVHTSDLHEFKLLALQSGWDKQMPVPTAATNDLQWWIKNLYSLNGRLILQPSKDYDAATDACDYGWGAWITANMETISWGGLFSRHQINNLHINQKELLAILLFLRSCPIDLTNKVVDIGIDNTTALSYVRKLGGRKKYLSEISDQIWEILQNLKVILLAYHLPGEKNTLADLESRRTRKQYSADLQLTPKIFRMVDRTFGPHTMDAFSTAQNTQLPRFGSWEPQPLATWIDSMTQSWKGENLYVNPPFSLMGRILQKIEAEGTTVTIIAPYWPAQPWFPKLMALSIAPPLLLPHQQGPLFQHPLLFECPNPTWMTLAWRVSGKYFKRSSTTTRSTQHFWRGNLVHSKVMSLIGPNGSLNATQTEQIRLLSTTLRLPIGWANWY
jgi:hypothetical protein